MLRVPRLANRSQGNGSQGPSPLGDLLPMLRTWRAAELSFRQITALLDGGPSE